ncbi:pyridoxamine 5'-phosphate oxidase family protein [Aeromicrobium sp. YIM 150415]|uniref:pyridoxamine 5'-phosphate oxidase family protein n=1 Tax=Aeromicrobium sp. YIM 150415 TaxID=2803912 RepID=UPI001963041C|nr:pyridoxamine 5'-phosphate oxidase family protein [Aeromicrobium sp. YIM 150415]MBM9464045.1 pyridoxamine 5'-phosphate oxidase family protein [Aeromicrobium sp. YIM 150415]
MSRRAQIAMSEQEVFEFLDSQMLGVFGSIGPDGAPHLVHMGFMVEDREIVVSSFAAAQKIRNLERSDKASFLVETSWPYAEIRGVMLTGETRIVRDTETVIDVTTRMRERHRAMSGSDEGTPEIDIARHAPKRVVVYLTPGRIRSWDHRRLGGSY